jgi:nicotinate-nucleotide pyrophosphorylase (carboxylating)
VEVDTLVQLDEAIAAGADIIMLDNFDTDATREAVKRVAALGARRPVVEVSGGITQDRIAELAALGVDVISSGALTHSAPAADISLELVL